MKTDFDRELCEALTVYNRALVANLPDETEYAAEFSPRHQRRMERLFARCDRFYYPAIRTKARCAMALAATVALVLILPFSVGATGERFAQFVTEVYTVCTDLFFPASTSSTPFVSTEPTYIPAGFKEVSRETDTFSNYITYRNNEGKEIYYHQQKISATTVTLNTENAQVEKIILNNNVEAMYVYRQDFAVLCFVDNGIYYNINALLSREELIQMANSILK